MANKTLLMLAKVDGELGFTPSSRTRVTVTGSKGKKDEKRKRFFGT